MIGTKTKKMFPMPELAARVTMRRSHFEDDYHAERNG
jgi:hypothetical protein